MSAKQQRRTNMKKLPVILIIGLIFLYLVLLSMPIINYYSTDTDVSFWETSPKFVNEEVDVYLLTALIFLTPIMIFLILFGTALGWNKLILGEAYIPSSPAKALERYEKKHGIDYSKFKYSYDDDDDDKKEN